MLWSDQMGISNLTGTTYADVTGSKYFCPVNARLREITVVIAGDAATSLIEGVDIRFNSPQWGRDLVVSASGRGPQDCSKCSGAEFQVSMRFASFCEHRNSDPIT